MDISSFTYPLLEKYLKRFIGRNIVEVALQRLDELTQEEAQVATAAMHSANDGRISHSTPAFVASPLMF